jgi:hypothetical protein
VPGLPASRSRQLRARIRLTTIAAIVLSLSGCEWINGILNPSSEPQGYWLPLTVELRFDPTVNEAALDYTDACREAKSLPIGEALRASFGKEMAMTFEKVRPSAVGTGAPPGGDADAAVDVSLGLKDLQLFITRQGDRSFPATLTLGATAVYVDGAGTVVHSKNLRTEVKGEVTTKAQACEIGGLAQLAKAGADKLAQGFKRHLGTAIKIREMAQSKGPKTPGPRAQPRDEPPALSFRALIADQNADQAIAAGEEVMLQAEVTNAGPGVARDVVLRITGTGVLAEQFRDPVAIGLMQPGESKRVEVRRRVPAVTSPEEAEFVLTISAAGVVPGPGLEKRFHLPVRPAAAASDNAVEVDTVSDSFASRTRQNAAAVVVGINTYREASVPAVSYADADADLVGRYLTAAVGVPADRVRVLTNDAALKADVAEAIEEWLPRHVKAGGVVFLYLAGQARLTESGSVEFLPHEAAGAADRNYSLRRLYDAIAATPVQRVIVVLDVVMPGLMGEAAANAFERAVPAALQGGKLVQLVRTSGDAGIRASTAHHGDFTRALLAGIRGNADADGNRLVTLGELCRYVSEGSTAGTNGQRGIAARCVPSLSSSDRAAGFPLVRLRAS